MNVTLRFTSGVREMSKSSELESHVNRNPKYRTTSEGQSYLLIDYNNASKPKIEYVLLFKSIALLAIYANTVRIFSLGYGGR